MRIIVTGATGLLGIALIDLLLGKNMQVTALVRRGSERTSFLPQSPLLTTIEADLSQLEELAEKLNGKYDTFFHLGWTNTANRIQRGDFKAQLLNVGYALDAVELAHAIGCSVFIGAGSQSEYGDAEGTITEFTPTNPTEPYGMAKLSASLFCKQLCSKYSIRFGWLRIISMFGFYDRETTFVSHIIKELSNNRSPKLTKCEQIWDYIYSKDAALAFWLMAERCTHGATYPLSSGSFMMLREYAEIIRDAVSPDLPLGFGEIPYPPGQKMNMTADINPLIRNLSFKPSYTFEQAIAEMIESAKRNI